MLIVLVLWLAALFISFRNVRPSQWDRSRQLVGLRALCFRRDSPDPGHVHTVLGPDSGLQRSALTHLGQ